jgi:alcohol dehydrogenase class IV
VREGDFKELAGKSAANGSNSSNPRPMKRDDYLRLLKKMSRESG